MLPANEIQMSPAQAIRDLRSALDFLESCPGQLLTTKKAVDPNGELAGIYRRIGAGTPVAPPTRIGPAMVFENVTGYDMRVAVGLLASRERTALLLNSSIERLPFTLLDALNHPIAPVTVPASQAPCQENIHRAPLRLGWLAQNEVVRIRRLLLKTGIPCLVPDLGVERYLTLMGLDKKLEDGKIRFVLLKRIGEASVVSDIPERSLKAILSEAVNSPFFLSNAAETRQVNPVSTSGFRFMPELLPGPSIKNERIA